MDWWQKVCDTLTNWWLTGARKCAIHWLTGDSLTDDRKCARTAIAPSAPPACPSRPATSDRMADSAASAPSSPPASSHASSCWRGGSRTCAASWTPATSPPPPVRRSMTSSTWCCCTSVWSPRPCWGSRGSMIAWSGSWPWVQPVHFCVCLFSFV